MKSKLAKSLLVSLTLISLIKPYAIAAEVSPISSVVTPQQPTCPQVPQKNQISSISKGAISALAKEKVSHNKCELDLETMKKSYNMAINENHVPPPIWDNPWVRMGVGAVIGLGAGLVISNNVGH